MTNGPRRRSLLTLAGAAMAGCGLGIPRRSSAKEGGYSGLQTQTGRFNPGLLVHQNSWVVPTTTRIIETSGYSVPGIGSAKYKLIEYARGPLVDGDIVLADGRRFILAEEVVTPEMFGALGNYDPKTNYGFNDQPAWQSAINFVARRGGGIIRARPVNYKIVQTQRKNISRANFGAGNFSDGCALVIDSKFDVQIDAPKSALYLRGFGDVDIAKNWQIVDADFGRGRVLPKQVWRGCGIRINGGTTPAGRTGNHKIRIGLFDGGAGYTGAYPNNPDTHQPFPANSVSGDGWDVTHHCIEVEPDSFTGSIVIGGSELRNWRGEIIVQGGRNGSAITTSRNNIHSTNADGISISCSHTSDGDEIYRCRYNGIENGQFGGNKYDYNVFIHDCDEPAISLFWNDGGRADTTIRGLIVNCADGLMLQGPNGLTVEGNLKIVDCGWYIVGDEHRAITLSDNQYPIKNTKIHDVLMLADQGGAPNWLSDRRLRLNIGLKVIEKIRGRTENLSIRGNVVQSSVKALDVGMDWIEPYVYNGKPRTDSNEVRRINSNHMDNE